MSQRNQHDLTQCLGVDGKIVPGADTEMAAWFLEPQPDGSLRGVFTTTVLTNECGFQGAVVQVPVMAIRTGDVPTGVTVADPAGVAASPSTSMPAPPATGPVLDGTYRFDFDLADQTVDGRPTHGTNRNETQWWAFRSLCTTNGCVGPAAQLADNNQQEPSGSADLLHFADGRWQDTPYLQPPNPCAAGKGTGGDWETRTWWIQPQPDGSLRGVQTMTILTDECGDQGKVYRTPLVATRIGDVPPAVILADPALFQS
jgi:serine/threonine protein kinase, bacterial